MTEDVEKVQDQEQQRKAIYDVEYTSGFSVECKNILDDPKALQFPGYENFPIDSLQSMESKPNNVFIIDKDRVRQDKTVVMIILRYFEYVCIARMRFDYLFEIGKGGIRLIDTVEMIKHHLKNRLVREAKNVETINEIYCSYSGNIMY